MGRGATKRGRLGGGQQGGGVGLVRAGSGEGEAARVDRKEGGGVEGETGREQWGGGDGEGGNRKREMGRVMIQKLWG